MTIEMTSNLYVKSVATVAELFIKIGFVEIQRMSVGTSETIVLAPDIGGNARIQLWDIAFIRENSPEVADSKPSIAFSVHDLAEMHAKVAAAMPIYGEIQTVNGRSSFYFAVEDDQYFAFLEA
jgi:lactoylglutathione lyase